MGFPIRKSPDLCSFAAPRSLSQLVTSFIGSWCQGIPLAHFLAWPGQNDLSFQSSQLNRKVHLVLYYSWIMQAHLSRSFSLAKIAFTLKKIYPLLLPSHNCIIISQCSVFKVHLRLSKASTAESPRDSMKHWTSSLIHCFSQSLLLVESTGIEPVTSCLQGRRSPSWANPPFRVFRSGWPKWTRTIDLTIISRVL